MKVIDKVKKAVSSIPSKAINACSGFGQALNAGKEQLAKQEEMMEAFNQITSLSDSGYALYIKNTIEHICYCRSSPNYETFMSLSKLAIELLKSGVDQSDVLVYFDTILYMERGGERYEMPYTTEPPDGRSPGKWVYLSPSSERRYKTWLTSISTK